MTGVGGREMTTRSWSIRDTFVVQSYRDSINISFGMDY